MVVIGAISGHLYNRWAARQADPESAERMGVSTATGSIVGDGSFNIAYAAIVAATNDPDSSAIVHANPVAMPSGIAVFGGSVGYAYWRMRRDGAAR
ncbi:hypothetical protein OY671_011849 [Metschnikowia pulcherrima]|nr:hypothetical protein OY671_011849 [Metschnikowia pulcherrima]